MFIGEFQSSIYLKIQAYIIIVTLVIIYSVSQIYGHQPAFPKCWISNCATHYPEFVFFIIATISGSVLIILGWLTNHFYLKTISKQKMFDIDKYHPEISMILGIFGAMLLMGSTANLDTGKREQKWHTFCVSRFFIFTFIAQIYNTVICCIVYSKIKTLSRINLYFKLGIILLLLLQFYISSLYGQIGIFGKEKQLGNQIDILLQWTLTITVCMGFYSVGLDVDKFEFVYEDMQKSFQEQLEICLVD